MRELLRHHKRSFVLTSVGAIAFRLVFIFALPVVSGDSLIYGDIAKNWLRYGVFGLSTDHGVQPTYIRLPGYPAFLAAIFKIFGMEHYTAAMLTQMFVDVATCFVTAALVLGILAGTRDEVWRRRAERAALSAFFLTAFCPFLANYVAAPLSETWSIFLTAAALLMGIRGMRWTRTTGDPGKDPTLSPKAGDEDAAAFGYWLGCGAVVGIAILFRPDNGLLAAVIGGALLFNLLCAQQKLRMFKAGLAFTLAVVGCMAPWTVRNLRTMHRFEPLAPRYANDPGEPTPMGFNRWVKTWIVDFISVQQVYWNVDGNPVDPNQLPTRAFDNEGQRQRTLKLLDEYNDSLSMTPEFDARFGALAAERIRAHPVRYYIELPLARIADMWLRPRTEMLPIETDWWNYDDHDDESRIAMYLGALNLFYLVMAVVGFVRCRRSANLAAVALLAAFILARTALLGTLENPEPRYTLECFPIVLALAAIGLTRSPRASAKVS
ncbi:MAG TPA: hypothetical protein VGR50_07600 [Terriglobales bacterium]|nr:hypothetical protein [Terriglobales bacterium]